MIVDDEAAIRRTTRIALEAAFKAAETSASILIPGPIGTGKSVLAREIHRRSGQRAGAFVTVGCPSFSRELLESELFGHVRGVITLEATAAEEGFVRVAVRDRGPGIPAASIAHVFDRFYRAPDREKKGAGLGLAITRAIVVADGGGIACHRAGGEGAEFYFLLPR